MGGKSKFFQAGGDRLVDNLIARRDSTGETTATAPRSKFFQSGGGETVAQMIARRDAVKPAGQEVAAPSTEETRAPAASPFLSTAQVRQAHEAAMKDVEAAEQALRRARTPATVPAMDVEGPDAVRLTEELQKAQSRRDRLASQFYFTEQEEQKARLTADGAAAETYRRARELQNDIAQLAEVKESADGYLPQSEWADAARQALANKYGESDMETLYRRLIAENAGLKRELTAAGFDFDRMREYETRLESQAKAEEARKQTAAFAEEHPVLSSGASVLVSPLQGIDFLSQAVTGLGHSDTGKLDTYIPLDTSRMAATNFVRTTRGTVDEKVQKALGETWGPVGSFAYNTGMSMADFLFNAAITGNFTGGLGGAGTEAARKAASNLSLAIMGTSAASNTTLEATERGLSNRQALTLGAVAGLAEVVTEKVSLEALLDKTSMGKSLAGYIAKNVISEGSEEVASDLINLFADVLIAKDKSQWETAIRYYEAQGMTEDEAFWHAVKDQAMSMGLDFLGGAISGGVMAGGNVALQTVLGNRTGAGNTETGQATPADSLQAGTGTVAGTDAPQAGRASEAVQRADSGVLADPLVQALFGQKITAPQTEAVMEGANTIRNRGEAGSVVQKLKESIPTISKELPVATVSTNVIGSTEGKTMAEKARALFSQIKGIVTRQGFGDVEISDRSVNDDLRHGVGPAKAAVIPAIPSVIQNGIQIEFQEKWKGRPYDGYIFAAPVTMDGETVYVAAVVKRTSKNKFYLHEVVDSNGNIIKIGNDARANPTSLAADGDAGTQASMPTSDTILPQGEDGVKGEFAPRRDTLMQAMLGPEEITPGDGENSVGAAARGFTTPGTERTEATSRLADGAAMFNRHEAEATAIPTREDYNRLFRYEVQSEEQSMQYAREQLYALVNGKEAFLADFAPESYASLTEELRQAPAWNGVMTDMAMLIKQELQRRSINMETSEDVYVDWLETMREHATETGRGTQAWAKWTSRDNDTGQSSELDAWKLLENSDLTEAEKAARFRQIVQYDAAINGAETTGDLKSLILEIAGERGTLNGITGKQSEILAKVAENALDGMDFEQLKQFAYASSSALAKDATGANMGQKAKTVQILNMLSNPKTAAKNLLGNTTFYGLDAMSMRGAALLDMAVSRLTGTRSMAFESSALASRQSREAIAKAVQLSLAEITMDVDMGSGNRYTGSGRTNKAKGQGLFGTRTAADTFAERVLSACERNMGYLMTATDEAYKGAARNTASGTQALIDAGKIRTEDGDYAKSRADELALYRTFQGNSRVTAAIQTIHDLLNLIGVGDSGKTLGGKKGFSVHSFGLGDLVSPFTRVAGNLASVGLDYSPVNAAKGTVELLDVLRRTAAGQVDPARQYKAVSDLARGLSGTAIAYGVALLANAGLVRRASDEEDKDVAALNQSEGLRGTQINIDAAQRWLNGESPAWKSGDTLVDLSNLEPINFIISLGVELADNEADGLLSTFVNPEAYRDTGTSLLQAAGDLPVLSSVSDLAKDTMVYGTPFPEAAAEMLGKTAISSITPNVVAAFAKGLDSKQRNLYTGDGVTDVLRDTLISRLPGARESLPTTVNTVGEEKDNPGTLAQRLLNAMLNPLGVNEYTQGEVSREMERVREETGDTSFYPTTRNPKSLSYKDREGKTHEVELTYEQRQQFQRDCAAVQMTSTAAMMGSELYRGEDPETQAALLKRCYDFAYQAAKASVLGDDAADAWVRNARTSLQDIGLSQTEYLYYLEKYGSGVMSGSGYEKTCRMVKAGLTVDEWVRMYQNMDTDGNGAKSKAELTAYIEEHFPESRWSEIFEAYKGGSNWKNPYTE